MIEVSELQSQGKVYFNFEIFFQGNQHPHLNLGYRDGNMIPRKEYLHLFDQFLEIKFPSYLVDN